MCLNGKPTGRVKMHFTQLPHPQVIEFKYRKHTPEQWMYEHRSEREIAMWMKQLEEDAEGHMQQESTTTWRVRSTR